MLQPFFSICVPQYARVEFFTESCRSLAQQEFQDFEVCISDDGPADGREVEYLSVLQDAGIRYRYRRQKRNRRYDCNLRTAIGMASGRYCFLLGNDDGLAGTGALRQVRDHLADAGFPPVAICNYEDWETGRSYWRVPETRVLGSGPACADSSFRSFSFVSGVVLASVDARRWATRLIDGSEMYQMWLGTRIIAAGGQLLGIAERIVRKDIRIPGHAVDSYAMAGGDDRRIRERRIPLVRYAAVAASAIEPFVGLLERRELGERLLRQVLAFTYPFWLIEYRRTRSWRFACGVCLGMRPRNSFAGVPLGWAGQLRLCVLFVLSSTAGLIVPLTLFAHLRWRLYALAKGTSYVES